VIEDKIMTRKRFSTAVETLVKTSVGVSYIEAAASIIEDRGMDFKSLNRLLSDSLKQKIEQEAIELNLLRIKGSNKLPI
jgi:hypothetical protein|tara:strand:- start:1893 stop:2129 length:237 start_codon:yes stop_codon:yes gene_type:complete